MNCKQIKKPTSISLTPNNATRLRMIAQSWGVTPNHAVTLLIERTPLPETLATSNVATQPATSTVASREGGQIVRN